MTALEKLTRWYADRCDGRWEHQYGFQISTLDNPGVAVDVDLVGTTLERKSFTEVRYEYDSLERWMTCRRTAERFEARGAPSRLEDMVLEFLKWAECVDQNA